MLSNLTGWHFLIILVVILLLFGAPKLPGLARSLGQSMKIFKSEITPERTDETRPGEPPVANRATVKGHPDDSSHGNVSGTPTTRT